MATENRVSSAIIKSLGIFLGLVALGYFIHTTRIPENTVSVKGLATREVKANNAVLEIDYREVGANLITLSQKINHDQEQVLSFLKTKGFQITEIQPIAAKVNDAFANSYGSSNNSIELAKHRYTLTGGVLIHSANVDLVQQTNQQTSALLTAGVPLSFDTTLYPNPTYFYSSLDSIRPQMLAEATQSARLVAEQFAKDSNSQIGNIRRASQGQFQIMSRDSDEAGNSQQQLSSIYKKIRLVTTVDYYLKK
ncbi:MAG: SIMPL domain-containing protein [Gammaproteobacteria bacterium]|nr:SIMPL domain-containing protein [Gammaproteobacteria bacterium]